MNSNADATQLPLMGDLFTTVYDLSGLYRRAHDMMRNIDGLQPQEAFDELLKLGINLS